jgi:hypothetical protein
MCSSLLKPQCRGGDSAKAKAFYTRLVAQTANADSERPALKVAKALLAER